MKRRIFFHEVRAYDLKYGDSLVRELEMTLDYWLKKADYSPQFWTDAQTYGLDEAVLCLKNQNLLKDGGIYEIEKSVAKIKALLINPCLEVVDD